MLTAAALVVALAALGVSLWVLLKKPWTENSSASETTSAAPPEPSPQQIADAKVKACAAYTLVSNAVNFPNTTEAEKEAAGANVRLAASLGHTYLLERIATPPALADAIRRYAANLEDVAMFSLAGFGTDDPAQAARVNDWGPLNTQITDLCK